MNYKLLILLLFPSFTLSACFENDYLESIDYWYYHNNDIRTCMETLTLKPSESICNTENNRIIHFVRLNNAEPEWWYYNYEDKIDDKLIFKNDILLVNNNIIKGKKTKRALAESKTIEHCNEPPISINESLCSTVDMHLILKKQIIIAIINYIFSENNIKDLFYKEISIDSQVVDLNSELQRIKIKHNSISYRFKNFRKCGEYLVVNLISYSAPKASSEKIYILKTIDNTLEIIKVDLLWIS